MSSFPSLVGTARQMISFEREQNFAYGKLGTESTSVNSLTIQGNIYVLVREAVQYNIRSQIYFSLPTIPSEHQVRYCSVYKIKEVVFSTARPYLW